MKCRLRQRGVALLIVLWTLALLALLATEVLTVSRQDTQLARNLLDAATVESAADGAVRQAIWHVLDSSTARWNADGLVHVIRIGETSVTVRIDNEANKVNPGIAAPQLLQALLLQVGADPVASTTLATSIVQWRLGSGPLARRNTTFLRYQRAGMDYAPSGAPLDSIDELGSVIGMTPDLLARLRPHLTVFTGDDPGAGTRDPVVAQALALAGQSAVEANDVAEQFVSVTADARGPDHGRRVVNAVVRINALPQGRRYEVLAYQRL
jgi:general secretion pathway protein K